MSEPGASVRRVTSTSAKRPDRSARPAFRCTECGWTASKWVGRCGECQAWGSVVEDTGPGGGAPRTVATSPTRSPAQPIDQIDVETARSRPTGVDELDRVLGGGIVPGAVVLLAGEPGVGKSTLLLDVAARAARTGRKVLYVTGEESAAQVRLRAGRIHALDPRLLLAAETDLGTVLGHIEHVEPDLLVLDSIQTIASAQVEGTAGGVSQVREVATAVIQAAKAREMPVVLIGHVTKDGSVAGPRVLEHLVDCVLQFEGDRYHAHRVLRAVKNRFGSTNELGVFEMTGAGLVGVPDASAVFGAAESGEVGSAVTCTIEGTRPLLLEIQALVAPSDLAMPRRVATGVDPKRLAMILAVLARHAGLPLGGADVFVNVAGGVRIEEPGADLGIALAVASASRGSPVRAGTAAFGEIGLTGRLRPATQASRRVEECRKLGRATVVAPAGTEGATLEAETLRHSLGALVEKPA
jgi:DNA repair protein RadA/Sms